MSTSLAIMSSTVKELAIKKNTRATRAHSTTKLICWPSWYNIITGCTKTERLLVRVNKSCLQGPQQMFYLHCPRDGFVPHPQERDMLQQVC